MISRGAFIRHRRVTNVRRSHFLFMASVYDFLFSYKTVLVNSCDFIKILRRKVKTATTLFFPMLMHIS